MSRGSGVEETRRTPQPFAAHSRKRIEIERCGVDGGRDMTPNRESVEDGGAQIARGIDE